MKSSTIFSVVISIIAITLSVYVIFSPAPAEENQGSNIPSQVSDIPSDAHITDIADQEIADAPFKAACAAKGGIVGNETVSATTTLLHTSYRDDSDGGGVYMVTSGPNSDMTFNIIKICTVDNKKTYTESDLIK